MRSAAAVPIRKPLRPGRARGACCCLLLAPTRPRRRLTHARRARSRQDVVAGRRPGRLQDVQYRHKQPRAVGQRQPVRLQGRVPAGPPGAGLSAGAVSLWVSCELCNEACLCIILCSPLTGESAACASARPDNSRTPRCGPARYATSPWVPCAFVRAVDSLRPLTGESAACACVCQAGCQQDPQVRAGSGAGRPASFDAFNPGPGPPGWAQGHLAGRRCSVRAAKRSGRAIAAGPARVRSKRAFSLATRPPAARPPAYRGAPAEPLHRLRGRLWRPQLWQVYSHAVQPRRHHGRVPAVPPADGDQRRRQRLR